MSKKHTTSTDDLASRIKLSQRTLTARLVSEPGSAYSPSKALPPEIEAPQDNEDKNGANARCAPLRLHYDQDDQVFIPSMALAKAIVTSARRQVIKIPGEGKATITKNVTSGIMIPNDVNLGINRRDVPIRKFFLSIDPGGGKRTWRHFPVIDAWAGTVTIVVLDPKIKNDVLEQCLVYAGTFVGLGRWRPENGGLNGRFAVESATWS